MAKPTKPQKPAKSVKTEEPQVFLNMTYEEAMKKALNTPLPKKQ